MPEVETGSVADFALANVFERLADGRATGVLEVTSERGRKLIVIEAGKVALVSEGGFRREMLGEILVERDKIGRQDLQKALELQKFRNVRLGEILAEMGLLSSGDIEDVLRAQIEDELCDLFSWQQGNYEFRAGQRLDAPLEAAAVSVAVDPKTLLLEAAKRVRVWPELEQQVPSPYAVFKLTGRGRKLLASASSGARRFVVLIDEGRTVSDIVRRSYLGRFTVYKTLADLVRTGCIAERSDDEIEALARDMVNASEYSRARGLYLRMLEKAATPHERQRWQAQAAYVDELDVRTRRTPVVETAIAPALPRRPSVVSRAGRLAAVLPYRLVRAAALALALLLVAAVAVVTLSQPVRNIVFDTGRPELPAVIKHSRTALEKKDYTLALRLLNGHLVNHPTGQSRLVVEAERDLVKTIANCAALELLRQAGELENSGRLGEAVRLLADGQQRFTCAASRAQIITRRTELEGRHALMLAEQRLQELQERLKAAEAFLAAGRPEDAAAAAAGILETGDLPPQLKSGADNVVASAKRQLARQEALLTSAAQAKQRGDFSEAGRCLSEVLAVARLSAFAPVAATELEAIQERRRLLDEQLERAGGLLAAGKPREALEAYRAAARHEGFFQAETARKRAVEIEAAFEEAARLLDAYRRTLKDKKYALAQEQLERLTTRYSLYSDLGGLLRPLDVLSVPPGASVLVDGAEAGATPLTVLIPLGRRVLVRIKKPGFQPLEETVEGPFKRAVSAYLRPEAKRTYTWKVRAATRVLQAAPDVFLAAGPAGAWLLPLDAEAVSVHAGPVSAAAASEDGLVFADDTAIYQHLAGKSRRVAAHSLGAPLACFAERLPAYGNQPVAGIVAGKGAGVFSVADGAPLAHVERATVSGVALLPNTVVIYDGASMTSLDRSGLRMLWAVPASASAGPVATTAGSVTYLDAEGNLVDLDAASGLPVRKKPILGLDRGPGILAAIPDGAMLLKREYVYRLSWLSGLVWERLLDRRLTTPLVAVTGRSLCVAGSDAFFRLSLDKGVTDTKTGWSGSIIGLAACTGGVMLFATDGEVVTGYLLGEAQE